MANPAIALVKEEFKRCGNSNCSLPQPLALSCFYKSKATKSGLHSFCRQCQNAASKKWVQRNPKKIAEKGKRLREALKKNNPQKAWAIKRNSALKMHYGITLDHYNLMAKNQNYGCAICGDNSTGFSNPSKASKGLVVDHCHATGKVRALLCCHCNRLLGTARDNIKTLQNATQYLEKHNGN